MTLELWSAQIKRLRLLLLQTQEQFAEMICVEQATVSRWERGVQAPDIQAQRRLRELQCQIEPAIDRRTIERAPGLIAIGHIGDAGRMCCTSNDLAALFQRSPNDMRGLAVYDLSTESIFAALQALNTDEAWARGEVASWETITKQHCGSWVRWQGTRIGRTGLCMWIGGPVAPPKHLLGQDFELTIAPFDDLIS